MGPAAKLIVVLAVVATGSLAAMLARPVRGAPEARFTTLSGESLAISTLRGKVLAVNFWSTSCAHCVAEMPRLARTYRSLAPRGYEMIAVAVRQDRVESVSEFARLQALPFKVAHDRDGEIAKRFGNIHLTPTTFIIDRRGRVLRRFVGTPDWRDFDAVVERALRES